MFETGKCDRCGQESDLKKGLCKDCTEKSGVLMEIALGNLLEKTERYRLDGIQNAANGIGVMGAGIAGAIRSAGGIEIQQDALRVCELEKPEAGQAYATMPGALGSRGIKYIIHAVTMKQPGGDTSLSVVRKAFSSALVLATTLGIKRLGCTALGTGIGGLDPNGVAIAMFSIAQTITSVEVVFVDFDVEFIRELRKCQEVFKV